MGFGGVMNFWGTLLLLAVFFCLTGCTSSAPSQPEQVDVKQIQSIFFGSSSDSASACAVKVEQDQGKVLYQNTSGVLMTNLPSEKLSALECEGIATSNQREQGLPKGKRSRSSGELDTLLKLLPAEEIGARTFIKNNPEFDGRKVIVAVLDTGIELDHPMLKKTSTGDDKIIDFQDFSGEGKVSLQAVNEALTEIFQAPNGTEYSLGKVEGDQYHFAEFKGSTITLDNDDTFADMGVVTYFRDGKWRAKVDTDGDKNFGNETEVSNYSESRSFIRLGAKKTLSSAINIFDDGKSATLCFDNGSHGTHVAGIAAGYQAHGLQGVAPGAQVMAVKIGDNRLSGGSTTTASKMLAIDYAVKNGAKIINISYGIRAGSNLGQSAIDRYVDKIAKDHDVLFSISAGNEGPGLQTIGTPAGAMLAITPAAYVSKETAQKNYGYLGVQQDNLWYFSSVGPQTNGGWKPTISAPGSALSSLPVWAGGHENYRGTSMSAPQVSGGLALLMSAAVQSHLPTERALMTRAVYAGAKVIPGLAWIQQGHGLMNVPASLEVLKRLKGEIAVDYALSINSPTSPTGRGTGIFVRSASAPANFFTVNVKAELPRNLPSSDAALFLRTYDLKASASWIQTPGTFWLNNVTRNFQVALDYSALTEPGLYSEKITVIEEATGEIAFEIPVTVVKPALLDEQNGYRFTKQSLLSVGDTQRFFVNLPAGTTAVTVDIESDGPKVWGQLLDPEGRTILDIADTEAGMPQSPLSVAKNIYRAGVYELDVVAPATNLTPANISLTVKAHSLEMRKGTDVGGELFYLEVQNNFKATKVKPSVALTHVQEVSDVEITGNSRRVPISWTEEDAEKFSLLSLHVSTAKQFYDLMTDYPYTLFCEDGSVGTSGGLAMESAIDLTELCLGASELEIQGAFAITPPRSWNVKLTDKRFLASPVAISSGMTTLIESGQSVSFPIATSELSSPILPGMQNCLTVTLANPAGKTIQDMAYCE